MVVCGGYGVVLVGRRYCLRCLAMIVRRFIFMLWWSIALSCIVVTVSHGCGPASWLYVVVRGHGRDRPL